MNRTRRSPILLLVAATALAAAAPASAQYFGRNPVQWERLKFEVLKTEHFDIHHYAENREAAEQVGRMAERWYTRLSGILGYQFKDRQPLILYASQPHFQQTNTIGGAPGEGTGGVTEAFKRRIVLPVGSSLAETDHVLGHELVHAFQYAMTGQGKTGSVDYGALNMPLWFIEGMAEYLSVGPVDPHTAMWMRDAAKQKKLPSVSDLASSRYFPYRYGQALWAYVAGRFGDKVIGDALRKVGARSNDGEVVLKEVLGVDGKTLTKDWHAAITAALAAAPDKKAPTDYGTALVTKKEQGGSMNVGPALSPDGSRLAFLSERDLFSIELFVSDTKTGRVERRLSQSAVDPHVESLQFINSAGGWSRDGQRFALGAVAKGRPLLVLLNTATGKTLREIPFPQLGEIATPSFSPDGTRIVFSALVSGFTDLYVYDLRTDTLKRLTEDAFADLQPAWSPDGHRVAFVTDRFSTRLESLDTGNERLATIDPDSGDIQPLPSFARAKNINPQWEPSGRSLYFLSDATGATNIYRLELASGATYRVTDLAGGVSGITATSPALSAAAHSGRLAYSVFEHGRYEIYTIDGAAHLAGEAVPGVEANETAGLIPGAKAEGRVIAARADAEKGLADPDTFTTAPYKPRLGLDYVGQPYVGAGISGRYGPAVAGGVSMAFSDMLGEHSLQTMLQAESVSGFTDVGAVVGYVNRKQRFNWGLQVGQVPYVVNDFAGGVVRSGGQLAYAEQVWTQRQIERSVSALGFYPFDSSLRLEVAAGFRHIGFDGRVETDLYSYPLGAYLGREEQKLPSAPGIDLYEGTLAVVRDTSLFGATSPVLGQRFRLDVSPVRGTVSYTSTLADFRHYVMPVRPITLAGRVMHYGRYGSGADDARLYPIFLGDASLVRGYSSGSFSIDECGGPGDGTCPSFERLFGSRVLVANVEARAPLFALFGAKNLYGPVPIEVGAFFDAGVAWDSASKPAVLGGSREWIKSVGATARVNLFGFAVVQVDYAKALDRAGRKPTWQVNLLTGF